MRRLRIALAALLGIVGTARGAPDAPAAADGRALFHGYAGFAAGGTRSTVSCADCHGATGSGGGEGLLRAPAITWAALTTARGGEPSYASPSEVLGAVENGEGRGRRPLSGAMPRVRLTEGEARALLEYMRRVGTPDDRPPGVSVGEIRLGTMLPFDGAKAPVGQAVLAGLMEVIDAANAAGGVHGRRIVLIAVPGTPGAALSVLSREHPFALVGAILPEGRRVAEWQARNRVSSIAGLTVRARESAIGRWSLDLLPPLDIQRSALAGALRACRPGLRRVALFPDDDPDPARDDGVEWFRDPDRLRDAMAAPGSVGCVGNGLADLEAVAEATPKTWRRVTVLPVPAALLAEGRTRERLGLWRELGRASARIALELLAAAGPVLHERSLLDEVRALNGFEAMPGAPLHLRPGARFAYPPDTVASGADARPEARKQSGGDTP